MFPFRVK